MSSRTRYCHYPTHSCDDCTYMYTCSWNKYQVKQIHVDRAFYRDQKERIRLDSDSSNNSDSCDLCSSTSGSSVEAPSEYPDKGNVSSPIRLSELQSSTFCHRDLRGEASSSEADQADFKQENINTSLLITDCKLGPQIPSLVLPYTNISVLVAHCYHKQFNILLLVLRMNQKMSFRTNRRMLFWSSSMIALKMSFVISMVAL